MATITSAAWKNGENRLGQTYPGSVDATQLVALGTICRFVDATYGQGEFIYLKGATSTAAGDVVTFDSSTWATTRAAAGSALPRRVAISTAAVDASTKYGWYQIGGLAIANKTKTVSMTSGIAVAVATTALVIHSSSLKEIEGALVAVVSSATTTTNYGDKVILMIDRPHLQGRIS